MIAHISPQRHREHRENTKMSYLGVLRASVVKKRSPRIDICILVGNSTMLHSARSHARSVTARVSHVHLGRCRMLHSARNHARSVTECGFAPLHCVSWRTTTNITFSQDTKSNIVEVITRTNGLTRDNCSTCHCACPERSEGKQSPIPEVGIARTLFVRRRRPPRFARGFGSSQ